MNINNESKINSDVLNYEDINSIVDTFISCTPNGFVTEIKCKDKSYYCPKFIFLVHSIKPTNEIDLTDYSSNFVLETLSILVHNILEHHIDQYSEHPLETLSIFKNKSIHDRLQILKIIHNMKLKSELGYHIVEKLFSTTKIGWNGMEYYCLAKHNYIMDDEDFAFSEMSETILEEYDKMEQFLEPISTELKNSLENKTFTWKDFMDYYNEKLGKKPKNRPTNISSIFNNIMKEIDEIGNKKNIDNDHIYKLEFEYKINIIADYIINNYDLKSLDKDSINDIKNICDKFYIDYGCPDPIKPNVDDINICSKYMNEKYVFDHLYKSLELEYKIKHKLEILEKDKINQENDE